VAPAVVAAAPAVVAADVLKKITDGNCSDGSLEPEDDYQYNDNDDNDDSIDASSSSDAKRQKLG
jgi:hypothetical protein